MIERSHHELRTAFGDLLHGTVCKFAASVFDPISVRMASDLGFEIAIQGGSVASLQVLGAPDISLLTLDEYAEQVSRVGRASQIPVIGDADHGFGNALNVMRTVTELQKAGVAALTLEDTLLPAQHGEQSNVLIDTEEAASKIYAARFARSDDACAA
jgi:carboxyvinyl-carboxyphosphonate phosphorylmutase